METLKSIGSCLLGIAMFVVAIILAIFFIKWGAHASVIITPYVSWVTFFVFLVCLLILTPMAFFAKSRGIAAVGFYVSSFVFGLSLWLSGFLITYTFWGIFGVIIGVFLAGIGVVATGIIALVLNGGWSLVGIMILGIVMTYGTRVLGLYLAEKADNESLRLVSSEVENDYIVCPQCGETNESTDRFCKSCGTKICDN